MFNEIAKHYVEKIIPSDSFSNGGVCGDMDLLFPLYKVDVMKLIVNYNEFNSGKDIPHVYESFRSHALQSIYYNRGASKIRGGNILNAGMHHFGIAVDIVNKKNNTIKWDLDYTLLRNLANKIGLVSLSWELCHFQMIQTTEQTELRKTVYAYVVKWQKENGLVPDGIVGKKTIAKAKELYT